MRWQIVTGSPESVKAQAIVFGVFEDLDFTPLSAGKQLTETARQIRFKGKPGEAFFAFDLFGTPAKHLLVVGLGTRGALGPDGLREASALAVRKLHERFLKEVALALPLEADSPQARREAICALTEGLLLANERFGRYKTGEETPYDGLHACHILVPKKKAEYEEGARRGEVLAQATLFARTLVSEPSNVLTPARMAEEAKKLAKEYGFTLKVYDEKACEKMGMGAYLAVAQGSKNPPRFIHLSYRPKGARFRLGLVGKGLTFDSGGLSLKPADNMGAMKSDMAGSAAVLGAMKAIGELKPAVAVEAVMAMAENMPGGAAYRPGDVLTSMSGKTIEVLNTDAEGRLTLADALAYVQRQKVDAVVDLATLTGACVVALGPDYAGAMGNDRAFLDEVLAVAEGSGDLLWPLPLPEAYGKYIKSAVADVANISRIRWGGALTAGLFLKHFVHEGTPWVHLDIAGPALREDDGIDSHKAEGSGAGVRTLVRLALSKGA